MWLTTVKRGSMMSHKRCDLQWQALTKRLYDVTLTKAQSLIASPFSPPSLVVYSGWVWLMVAGPMMSHKKAL